MRRDGRAAAANHETYYHRLIYLVNSNLWLMGKRCGKLPGRGKALSFDERIRLARVKRSSLESQSGLPRVAHNSDHREDIRAF